MFADAARKHLVLARVKESNSFWPGNERAEELERQETQMKQDCIRTNISCVCVDRGAARDFEAP